MELARPILIGPVLLVLACIAGAGEPRKVTLGTAILELRKEAEVAWKDRTAWPRSTSDFAHAMGWSVPRAQVVAALGRELGLEAPIEAYVKWQLLSFIDE